MMANTIRTHETLALALDYVVDAFSRVVFVRFDERLRESVVRTNAQRCGMRVRLRVIGVGYIFVL